MADRCGWAIVGFALMLTNPKGASAETRPSIAVVAYNQAGVNADTLARAKSEIARVFGEVGVDVNWMDSADLKPAGRFAIRLLIRARAVDARGSVMGTTIGGAHETGGMAFVFYDRVLKSAHEREQDVSRLLAYAMTHEMGHLLL